MAELVIRLSDENQGFLDFSKINETENFELNIANEQIIFEGTTSTTITKCRIYFSDSCFRTTTEINGVGEPEFGPAYSGNFIEILSDDITKEIINEEKVYYKLSLNNETDYIPQSNLEHAYSGQGYVFNDLFAFKDGIDFIPMIWAQFFYTEGNRDKRTNFVLVPNKWPQAWAPICEIYSWSTAYYNGLKHGMFFLDDLYFIINDSSVSLDIMFYKNNLLEDTYTFYFDTNTTVWFSDLWQGQDLEDEELNKIPVFYKIHYLDYQIKFRIRSEDMMWEDSEPEETTEESPTVNIGEPPANDEDPSIYDDSLTSDEGELTGDENGDESGDEESSSIIISENYETTLLNYYPSVTDGNYIKLIRYELIRDFNNLFMTLSPTGKYYFIQSQRVYSPYEEESNALYLNWLNWNKKEARDENGPTVHAPVIQSPTEGIEIKKYFTFIENSEDHREDDISEVQTVNLNNKILNYQDFYQVSYSSIKIFHSTKNENFIDSLGTLESLQLIEGVTMISTTQQSYSPGEEEFTPPKYLFLSDNGIALGDDHIINDNSFEVSSDLTTRLFGPAYFNKDTYINGRNIYNDLYYAPGEKATVYLRGSGHVSSSAGTISFECIPNKLLNLISTITITSITGYIRVINGGYIFPFNSQKKGQNWLSNNYFKAATAKHGNRIFIALTHQKKYYNNKNTLYYCGTNDTSTPPSNKNVTNNTPVALDLVIQFSFS